MMIRWTGVFAAFVLLLLSLSACGQSAREDDFYTFKKVESKEYIRVGTTRNELYAVASRNPLDYGIWPQYQEQGDDMAVLSLHNRGFFYQTMNGLSLNNHLEDVIPAYANDPEARVIVEEDTMIVLEKIIGGVRYTATFVSYKDHTLKAITLTNRDECGRVLVDYSGVYDGIYSE